MDNLNKLIQANKWMPIEDAPKDGGYILSDHKGWNFPLLTHWFDAGNGKGWWTSSALRVTPTHYRPLPTDDLAEICEIFRDELLAVMESEARGVDMKKSIDQALQCAEQKAKGEK